MVQPWHHHRYPDGSIDFAYYRAQATRLRRRAKRVVFRHLLSAVGRAVEAVVSPVRNAPTGNSQTHGDRRPARPTRAPTAV
jgi:hypothetical protein